ncbi:phage tail terminator family protein [Lactiplantibacillus herbarum]|uniref:phage tail terminator family protein n=1 Tax=Lactiplantibacillus herbarum TaxID=1670446 RepID=UPI00069D76AA|nr:hypothetical protein [Lactiplantibacillus herbarum]
MAFNISERIAMELAKLSPDIPIYREQQRGGFQEPSFFVNKITSHINPNLFGIQFRDNHFEVIYFPNIDKPNEDMDLMEEQLSDNFKQLEDFATVSDIDFERSDSTLIMTFRVSFRAVPVDKGTKQQAIDYQGGLKHD